MTLAKIAVAVAAASAQDIFLARQTPAKAHTCPPKDWVMQMYQGGHWILDYTDKSWDGYMRFLGLNEGAWPTERNTSDIHEYHIAADSSYYVMNHTIPLSDFHLFFKTALGTVHQKPEWTTTPYLVPTPAGFDPNPLKYNMTLWRNWIEEPGLPFPESCYALRTQNRGTYNDSGVISELVVDFTGELTGPYEWRYSLHVWNWTTGETIEPWKSQMQDAKPYPGVSYRYFKKAVQGFDDAVARHTCSDMTLDGESFEFC